MVDKLRRRAGFQGDEEADAAAAERTAHEAAPVGVVPLGSRTRSRFSTRRNSVLVRRPHSR
jgi:hypothetical protein